VTGNDTIDVGDADGYQWVRVKGKGSFLTSPRLKSFVEERIEEGKRRFVIDLGSCPAMDSTFMGTLAGLAMRLSKVKGEALQLADVSQRNRQSLQDLGLSVLIAINPEGATWQGRLEEVREGLESLEQESEESDAMHVLEAHRKLCVANEGNVQKFATVLDVLEKQAKKK
jgi:anti-anti-sigma regulatory factor